MDKLAFIDPAYETTSHLMYECNQRGHVVFFLEPHDVCVRDNDVAARMHNLSVAPDMTMRDYWQALIDCLARDEPIFKAIAELDALFLRKNPPIHYQSLELLHPVNDKVFIINRPSGQILGNSKLYALNFPDIIPETHIARDPGQIVQIIEDFGGDMVIKPLQRFGGEGVIKVSVRDREALMPIIRHLTRAGRGDAERNPVMLQAYLAAGRQGDVRILLLNGEILGAMRRVPRAGEFRSNIKAGATAQPHAVTEGEAAICRAVRDRLAADGLYFVGIDIIGDKLVEVNCLSPGGIPRINQFNHVQLEKAVIDFVAHQVMECRDRRSHYCAYV